MKVKKKKKKHFFFNLGIFVSEFGKHLIFALRIGAKIRAQNWPRKIPVWGGGMFKGPKAHR